jgi:hypothetical protein
MRPDAGCREWFDGLVALSGSIAHGACDLTHHLEDMVAIGLAAFEERELAQGSSNRAPPRGLKGAHFQRWPHRLRETIDGALQSVGSTFGSGRNCALSSLWHRTRFGATRLAVRLINTAHPVGGLEDSERVIRAELRAIGHAEASRNGSSLESGCE